jgi:hypothetical protein
MPSDLAVAVLLHLPPDRAIEVLDQPAGTRTRTRQADAAGSSGKLLAGVPADRVAAIFRVRTLFIPLIMSLEGNPGSQALFNGGTSPRASC